MSNAALERSVAMKAIDAIRMALQFSDGGVKALEEWLARRAAEATAAAQEAGP